MIYISSLNNLIMQEEIWLPVVGAEQKYLVSNLGKIKGIKSGKILRPAQYGCYLSVNIRFPEKKKTIRVHRLVALAFIPLVADKPQINHIDGNKFNNQANNLEWSTQLENVQHSIKVLGRPPGRKKKAA